MKRMKMKNAKAMSTQVMISAAQGGRARGKLFGKHDRPDPKRPWDDGLEADWLEDPYSLDYLADPCDDWAAYS